MKEIIIEKLKLVCEENKDIYAAIVFGSIKQKDVFSDIDVFLFTKKTKKYLSKNKNWFHKLGKTISKLDIINPIENVMISRIMLENYMTLDIVPIDYNEIKRANLYFFLKKNKLTSVIPNKVKNGIEEGMRTFYQYIRNDYNIIYDKGNITQITNKIIENFDQNEHINFLYKVNEDKFIQNYNEFWQITFKTIGMIVRNDLYYGITIYQSILKTRLVEIIEWYSYSFENKTNLRYQGRGIQNWANDEIKQQLRKTFSFENQASSYSSIENIVSLYQELSHKLIEKCHFEKNELLEEKVIKVIMEYRHKLVSKASQV